MRVVAGLFLITAVLALVFTKSIGGRLRSSMIETAQSSVRTQTRHAPVRATRRPATSGTPTYTDAEYGYSVLSLSEFPSATFLELPNRLGDVRRIEYRDLEINTFGEQFTVCTPGVATENLRSASYSWIHQLASRKGVITGVDYGTNWFLVSSVQPPSVFNTYEQETTIRLEYVGNCMSNTIWLRFPQAKEREYNSLISRLLASFHPGPLDRFPVHPKTQQNDAMTSWRNAHGDN